MATSNTVGANHTLHITPPAMNDMLDSALWGAKVRQISDTGTIGNATSDIGSTIKLGKLKVGDIPLQFNVNYTAMTAAVTGTIGDGNNASRYGAITSMAAAGKQVIPSAVQAIDGNFTDIVITTAGANANANGTINLTTLFSRKE